MCEVKKLQDDAGSDDEPAAAATLNLENSNLKGLVMTYEAEISKLKEKIVKLQSGLGNAGLDKEQQ
jgi:hypothetical protein